MADRTADLTQARPGESPQGRAADVRVTAPSLRTDGRPRRCAELRRSVLGLCPELPSESAGLTERRRCTHAPGAGEDDGNRDVWVSAPTGVHGHGPPTGARADPVADNLIVKDQR